MDDRNEPGARVTFRLDHNLLKAILGEEAIAKMANGAEERIAEELYRKLKKLPSIDNFVDETCRKVRSELDRVSHSRYIPLQFNQAMEDKVRSEVEKEIEKRDERWRRGLVDEITGEVMAQMNRSFDAVARAHIDRCSAQIKELAKQSFVDVLRESKAALGS